MVTDKKNTEDESPQPEKRQVRETQAAAGFSESSELSKQLKKLIEKLDVPKRKDIWDVLAVITVFMGTVVMSGVSLYVTQSYQRREADRSAAFQAAEQQRADQFERAQLAIHSAQIRVEELKAMTALAPILASRDAATRDVGKQMLQAIQAAGPLDRGDITLGAGSSPAVQGRSPEGRSPTKTSLTSVLEHFAAIGLSSSAPKNERIAATKAVGKIALSASTPAAVRDRAANIIASIAAAPDTPTEVKQTAAEILEKIKRVTAEEVKAMIASQPVTRDITEVILHHSVMPSASQYAGASSIVNLGEFQVKNRNWNHVSWHYAIAPDGAIWLGSPLNEKAIHTPGHQEKSVSVLLILDGDKELPTPAQRSSLILILRALFARFNLEATPNSPDGRGFHFHRDYRGPSFGQRTCPGSLLTKEMVLGWL